MAPPPRGDEGDLRERLARLEANAASHEKASAERHVLLLAAIADVRSRLERAEERSWKVVLAVAVLAAGSGVGGAELVKSLLAGGG